MDEFFSEEFTDLLPDDSIMALNAICREFRRFDQYAQQRTQLLEGYFKALAIFRAYALTNEYPVAEIVPGNESAASITNIRNYLYQQESETNRLLHTTYLEQETRKYTDKFDSSSVYVFSEDDYTVIQRLLNEIRDIITNSDIITNKHKNRLLERLERMQRELHKKTSDLDRFWGFIGEAGIVLGKFGNDIKPLIDAISELAKIVWKTIAIKETLLNSKMPITLPPVENRIDNSDAIIT